MTLRRELFYIKRSFLVYGRGFFYLWQRYILAPRIRRCPYPLERPITSDNLSMHMLTGHQDALIALWSLASFYAVSSTIGKLYIHDDGTLTKNDKAVFQRLFPHASIVSVDSFLDAYSKELERQSPIIRRFREEYPGFQSKKLLDPYFVSNKKMVLLLDSDILWFRDSIELTKAVENGGEMSLMMSNGTGQYVHVEFKDGSTTTDEIAYANSGITLYNKKNYSFERLTEYLKKVDYLKKKFTDQACFASILDNLEILSHERYIIKGPVIDGVVLRHYTSPSRGKFYIYGINLLNNLHV